MTPADHNEETFLRDCLAWRESDPIFKDIRVRSKLVFGDPESTKQIHKEIDEHMARVRNGRSTEVELPRAQPCMGFYTGKGAAIVVKVNQYARQ